MEPGAPDRNRSGGRDIGSQAQAEPRICPNCGLKLSHEIVVCPNDGTVLGKVADIEGKLSSQYEFIAEIGSGGMGVIYKARHVDLKQMVAVKMLHVNRLDEMSVRRFQQEAKAVSALDHPSIVRVRDFGITDAGQPHMVLDYIEGKTLASVIENSGALPVNEAVDIFIQICDALDHAHFRGVLHRDLKPSNVMLVPKASGRPLVKIVDFGIAKIADPENESAQANLTRTGEVFGSPLYMSPEQASGAKLDNRSDIYSLGCLMYETLTGTTPFVGGSSIEIIFRQLNDQAPTLREGSLGKEFPEEIERIIAKTLNKNPSARFQSMAELKKALVSLGTGSTQSKDESAADDDLQSTADKGTSLKLKALVAALAVLTLLAVASAILLASTFLKQKEVQKTEKAVVSLSDQIKERLKKPEVDLHDLPITDRELESFSEPIDTVSVNLDNSVIQGWGLATLIHLPLKKLSLAHSKVTDRGTEEIRMMPELEDLDLTDTQITNAGLNRLISFLHNVQKLNLSHMSIDQGTLRFIFHEMPKLK